MPRHLRMALHAKVCALSQRLSTHVVCLGVHSQLCVISA